MFHRFTEAADTGGEELVGASPSHGLSGGPTVLVSTGSLKSTADTGGEVLVGASPSHGLSGGPTVVGSTGSQGSTVDTGDSGDKVVEEVSAGSGKMKGRRPLGTPISKISG